MNNKSIGKLKKESVIDWFNANGYILFPLVGKVPVKNCSFTSLGASIIKPDHKGNYGILLKDDDLCIDIDPRHFTKPAKQVIDEFKAEYGAFDSFTVKTGGGGYHIFLKKPLIKTYTKLKSYSGFGFYSAGHYMVGAYSIHPDTQKCYMPLTPHVDISIKNAPDKLIRALSVPEKSGIKVDNSGIIDDSEYNQSRFTHYLTTAAPIAVRGEGGDNTTFYVACRARDFGLSVDIAYELMLIYWNPQCLPNPWPHDLLYKKVKNAYEYNKEASGRMNASVFFSGEDMPDIEFDVKTLKWELDSKGKVKKTLTNTVNYFYTDKLELHKSLRYNSFSGDIEFITPPVWREDKHSELTWKDSDAIALKYYMSDIMNYEVNTNLIEEAIIAMAHKFSYHPVKKWLNTLKWDNVPRLATWLSEYLTVPPSEYTADIGTRTLVAAVARIYNPGIKYDYVLVIEGAQGVGKSSAVDILGGNWFADFSIQLNERDLVSAMRGKWIIELSEMETANKMEANQLKAFVSRRVDRVRLAYGRSTENFSRQCIFIGTINPDTGYLKDPTGNRRFFPVRMKRMANLKKLKQDREQLFAEAKALFLSGYNIEMLSTAIRLEAEAETKKRVSLDSWAEWISRYLEDNSDLDTVTPREIWTLALSGSTSQFNRLAESRIFSIMSLLGWELRDVKRGNGDLIKVYRKKAGKNSVDKEFKSIVLSKENKSIFVEKRKK